MGQKLGNNLSQREASGVVLDPNDGQFPSRDPSGAASGRAVQSDASASIIGEGGV